MKPVILAPLVVFGATVWWGLSEKGLELEKPAETPPPEAETGAPLRLGPPPNWAGHIGEGRFYNPNCPCCQLSELVY